MKYNCDMVRDLMPLYLDNVCSGISAGIVQEHLEECPECSRMYTRMKNEEIENIVSDERRGIIDRQAGYFKRRSALIGAVIAGIFMVPVLICLIVNLASGEGLSWFFVVLCALLVASSLTVVPLMVPENKGLWTLGTFTASLLLLIGVVCILKRSATFFPAAAAILFSFSVVFLPIVIRSKPAKALNIPHKGLIVMLIDTALLILLLAVVAFYIKSPVMLFTYITVAAPFIGFAWLMFLVCYFPKWGKAVKAGICVIILGVAAFTAEYIVNTIIGLEAKMPEFTPFVWNAETIDGNITWIVLLAAGAVGIILIAAGLIHKAVKGRR